MSQLLLMGILLASGVLVTGLSDESSHAAEGRQARSWITHGPGALAVAAVSFCWLARLNPPPGVSNEPFLLVVPCLLFGQCFTGGAGSSVLLDNGAVWPDTLIAVRALGGDALAAYSVVIGLLALGVAVIFVVVARFMRPALAAPSAAFALALLGALSLASPLLDCSMTFLFSTAAAASLFIFALSGRRVVLLIAALFASHAVNAHTSAVSILPALVVLSAAAGESPVRSLGLAVITYVTASTITSWQALAGTLGALYLSRLLLPAAIGATILGFLGIRFQPLYRRLTPQAKAGVVAALLVLPHVAGALVLLVIRHPLFPRYLPPIIAPLSASAALGLAWAAERTLPRRAVPWARMVLPMAASLCALSLEAWPAV